MKIFNKVYICLFSMVLISGNCLASLFDPYPNPYLNDSILATTFASKLRGEKIVPMEKLIRGECNQFKDYVYLSIKNWQEFENKSKSFNDANTYSQQLVAQYPYQQALQYTFPLGTEVYWVIENEIKTAINQKRNLADLLKEIDNFCLVINNHK